MKLRMKRDEMAQISMAEAALRTGKSKTTIWRAVKSGRISATLDDTAQYQIDEAELVRVFSHETISDAAMKLREVAFAPHETGSTAVLAAKLEGAEGIIAELRARINDLTGERDRLLALLPAPFQQASAKAKEQSNIPILLAILVLTAAAVVACVVKLGYVGSVAHFFE